MNTIKQRHEVRDQLVQKTQQLSDWFSLGEFQGPITTDDATKLLDLAIRHIRGCHELMDAVDNVLGVICCEGEIDSRHEFTQQLLDLMYELDPK